MGYTTYLCRAVSTLSSKSLVFKPTGSPKQLLPINQLQFGKSFTDHMLTVKWNKQQGWSNPEISNYGNLSLDPSAIVFHYGTECFEGLKAYKDSKGKIRMFRPDMNMNRFLKSCNRLMLPDFDKDELLKLIKEFLKVEQRWIPNERGYSLYLRPTAIATQASLGVGQTANALLFVIASPVGPYYKTGFSAVSLFASKEYVRAWPGYCD